MRRTVAITAFCLALLAAALYYAPFYLIVSDAPVKSDAVILFLGGERGTREKEARQLIQEGWAEYLIIPARSQVQKLDPNSRLVRFDPDVKPKTSNLKPAAPAALPNHVTPNTRDSGYLKPNTSNVKRFFEDTHQEAILARDMMVRLGLRSAILVSAPYHMRRIRIIADRVFTNSLALRCVPTRYETSGETFWLFNSYDRKFVLTEYAKIAWFLLYNPFL